MKKKVRFIGIDFGTSTSVVSYLDYTVENGVLISDGILKSVDFGEKTLIPTLIYDDNKKRVAGAKVSEWDIVNGSEFLHREFKMRLGSAESPSERAKAIYHTEEFFKYLAEGYNQWERAYGHQISEKQIYVSYPAKWETQQRAITVNAAQKAFALSDGDIRCIDEPTAALHYCIHSNDIEERVREGLRTNSASNILILDMGAGTTDLVLFRYIPNGSTTVLSKFPAPGRYSITFGGREVDQILKDHFLSEYSGWEDENENYVLEKCKKWKEECSNQLSPLGEETFVKYLPERILKIKERSFVYDKKSLGILLGNYLSKLPDLVNGAIKDGMQNDIQYRSENGRIDYVILTGGHSQWVFISDMLMGKWFSGLPGNENIGTGIVLPRIKQDPWRLIKTAKPQQVVSFGLCMSGMPIPVIQLSNTDVWLDIEVGLSRSQKVQILKKSVRLPQSARVEKEFDCKIFSEDYNISIQITPIIGRNADDSLDTISVKVPTSFWSDFINDLINGGKYRDEKIKLSLNCSFDENQLLRLSGTVSSLGPLGGKAYEEVVSMSPTQIAENISESFRGN
jgi:hypothetical protein